MYKVFLAICLILCASVANSQPSEQISTPPEQLSSDSKAQTLFGNYGRIALAILNADRKNTDENKKAKPTFLSHKGLNRYKRFKLI